MGYASLLVGKFIAMGEQGRVKDYRPKDYSVGEIRPEGGPVRFHQTIRPGFSGTCTRK